MTARDLLDELLGPDEGPPLRGSAQGHVICSGVWLEFFSLESFLVERVAIGRSLGHCDVGHPVTELVEDLAAAKLADEEVFGRSLLWTLQQHYPGEPSWMRPDYTTTEGDDCVEQGL